MINPLIPTGPLTRDGGERLNGQLAEFRRRVPVASLGAQLNNYRGGQFGDNLVANPILAVKLTAVTSGLYSWTEQISTGADYAGWVDLPGGKSGTNTNWPAFEPNDVAIDVTSSPLAFIQRAYYDSSLDWVWQIVAMGSRGTVSTNLRGTLTSTLSFGGTATMNVAGGGTLTVHDWLLSSGQTIASGIQVTVFQDPDGDWYVNGAQCP